MIKQFDLTFQLEKAPHEEESVNPVLQVLFVVEGSVRLSVDQRSLSLQKEEMMLVCAGSCYVIDSTQETILARACYSPQLLGQLLVQTNSLSFYSEVIKQQRDRILYEGIKKDFTELIRDFVRPVRISDCARYSLLFGLLDRLVQKTFHAQQPQTDRRTADERLHAMIEYVFKNYREDISLTDLSGKLYVSASTLSRTF